MNDPIDPEARRRLAAWRLAPARNPNFRADVHGRIGSRPSGYAAFARARAPLLACSLALALVAGAAAGRRQARDGAQEREAMAGIYVQSLDARQMAGP